MTDEKIHLVVTYIDPKYGISVEYQGEHDIDKCRMKVSFMSRINVIVVPLWFPTAQKAWEYIIRASVKDREREFSLIQEFIPADDRIQGEAKVAFTIKSMDWPMLDEMDTTRSSGVRGRIRSFFVPDVEAAHDYVDRFNKDYAAASRVGNNNSAPEVTAPSQIIETKEEIMKVFLIKIGKRTRQGNFQELFTRTVAVLNDTEIVQVRKYFTKNYVGFDVLVESVEIEDISGDIPRTLTEMPAKKTGSLENFKIKYTESEKKLFQELNFLRAKANETERALERSIMDRYKTLPYVAGYYISGMELHTDASGTMCIRLPIKSNEFFKIVKDCDDGMPEVEIYDDPREDTDPDIPF